VNRRAWLRLAVVVAALLAFGVAARADAPPSQYGLFGPDAPAITDSFTGLIWQRGIAQDPLAQTDFAGAVARCAAYAPSVPGEPASGWRVPSYKELLTLVDENPHEEYENGTLQPKAIDPNAFFGTPTDVDFWSSSLLPTDSSRAFTVNFRDGISTKTTLDTHLWVRCVHDAAP
jgi:hypothetical protein